MKISEQKLAATAFFAGIAVAGAVLGVGVIVHLEGDRRRAEDPKAVEKIKEGEACLLIARYSNALKKGCKISEDGKMINCPEDGSVTMGDIFGPRK